MLPVVLEAAVPGLEARWLDVSSHLRPGCTHDRALALVVTMEDADLWVCAAMSPAGAGEAQMREYVDEMDSPEGVYGAARCSAAFGMPWAKLTEGMLRSQLLLIAVDGEQAFMEQMRRSTPEQLVRLREALRPGLPGDVARALVWCRTYADSVH